MAWLTWGQGQVGKSGLCGGENPRGFGRAKPDRQRGF